MPRVNDSVQAAHRGAPPLTRSQLRAVVREWSLMLRGQGLPPEKVLVVVKTFVRDAIAPSVARHADADASDHHGDALVTDASQWCIEAYFEGNASGWRATPNDGDGGKGGRRA